MPRLEKEINLSPKDVGYSRLGFFLTFLKSQGLVYEDVAKLVDMTRIAVSHWFIADDMNLAMMKRIIDKLGYRIEISLYRENVDTGQTVMVDTSRLYKRTGGEVTMTNLSFLTMALLRYGISKEEMAKSIGLGYTAVRFWFQRDDVSMSRLFQVCEGLGFSMDIRITPKDRPVQEGGRHLRTEIILSDDVVMKDTIKTE